MRRLGKVRGLARLVQYDPQQSEARLKGRLVIWKAWKNCSLFDEAKV